MHSYVPIIPTFILSMLELQIKVIFGLFEVADFMQFLEDLGALGVRLAWHWLVWDEVSCEVGLGLLAEAEDVSWLLQEWDYGMVDSQMREPE